MTSSIQRQDVVRNTMVAVTGWEPLDPLVAIAVAVNIVVSGVVLVRRKASGLMDAALSDEELAEVEAVLDRYRADGVTFHALRTRQAGRQRPSLCGCTSSCPARGPSSGVTTWSSARAGGARRVLPDAIVDTHLEPVEDPASWLDAELDRDGRPPDP